MQTRMTIGLLAVTALAVAGCGNKTRYANKPRQALPINLTVYIGDARVSVSPASIGAGPVVFDVTNQSGHAESLSIAPTSGGGSLANTGPINPQGTAQVAVKFDPGTYAVSTSTAGSDASQAQPNTIAAAQVHVGRARAGATGDLLTP